MMQELHESYSGQSLMTNLVNPVSVLIAFLLKRLDFPLVVHAVKHIFSQKERKPSERHTLSSNRYICSAVNTFVQYHHNNEETCTEF